LKESNIAEIVPNFTTGLPVVSVEPRGCALSAVPIMVTVAPDEPSSGVIAVIFGITLNVLVPTLVPAALPTVILPVVAPFGTTTLIMLELIVVIGAVAGMPLKSTWLMPERSVPEIVTVVPAVAPVGVNDVIFGGLIMVKLFGLAPEPSEVTTVILPVNALVGTTAVI